MAKRNASKRKKSESLRIWKNDTILMTILPPFFLKEKEQACPSHALFEMEERIDAREGEEGDKRDRAL